jgi:Heterokaryon incompatibility protein (HET)
MDEFRLASEGSVPSKLHWVVPYQRYNRSTSLLDIARNYIRFALTNRQTLVFKLLKDENTSTGYRLNYKLSFSEPYLAISHAWTDRTGPGDAITVSDLAPWPIAMSPAKRHLLDWLFKVQGTGGDWTSWFWLDLFCIDQTKQDELLFSQQLQQIPEVFGNARSCLALLASWPCGSAQLCPEFPEGDTEDAKYNFANDWLREHTATCSCPALVDAWLTRIWARQEVLYSKNLMMVTANVWLADTFTDLRNTWTAKPTSYKSPHPRDGVRELASCLITWCTRYGFKTRIFSSSVIADIVRLLIRGDPVNWSLLNPKDSSSRPNFSIEINPDWFVFNWDIILNGSIRLTSHIRDAILSQMLLLPGYQVPETPWSMPLQDLMIQSCKQYRQLLGRYQLVPMVLDNRATQRGSSCLAPMLSRSLECAQLCDILLAVGSPCTFPRGKVDDTHGEIPEASLVGYEIDDGPLYRVLQILDIEQDPHQAAEFFGTMKPLWSEAERCRTSWNICECLDEIAGEANSDIEDPHMLKMALKHCVGRLTHTTAFSRVNIDSQLDPGKPYSSAEIDELALPPIRAVEISHRNAKISPYTNLLFGELELGEEGVIWGLGIDKGTKLEFGLAAEEEADGSLRIRASGALMPTVRRNRLQNMSGDASFAIRPIFHRAVEANCV